MMRERKMEKEEKGACRNQEPPYLLPANIECVAHVKREREA